MAETAPKKAPEPTPKAPTLARAAEATDPAVHALLAEIDAHRMNKETAEAGNDSAQAKEAADKLADAQRRLAELGYE